MCNWVNEDWQPFLVVRMNQPQRGEIMVEKRTPVKPAPLFRAPVKKPGLHRVDRETRKASGESQPQRNDNW